MPKKKETKISEDSHFPESMKRAEVEIIAEASEGDCSDAYIHVRMKGAGLSLAEVLEALALEMLLPG